MVHSHLVGVAFSLRGVVDEVENHFHVNFVGVGFVGTISSLLGVVDDLIHFHFEGFVVVVLSVRGVFGEAVVHFQVNFVGGTLVDVVVSKVVGIVVVVFFVEVGESVVVDAESSVVVSDFP